MDSELSPGASFSEGAGIDVATTILLLPALYLAIGFLLFVWRGGYIIFTNWEQPDRILLTIIAWMVLWPLFLR